MMKHYVIGILAMGLVGCQSATTGNQTASQAQIKSASGGCNSAIEDFQNWVTGGQECLAMRVFRSKETFDAPPTLVIALHGDGASGSRADRAPQTWIDQIQDNILDQEMFKKSNSIIAVIARLGYPIDGVGRSTGHRPEPDGRRATYRPEYIAPIFDAVKNLAAKYQPQKIVAWGSSGRSASLAIGAGIHSDTPISQLLLGVCPCDVPTWEHGHGWPSSGAYSPLDYATKIPNQTEVILVVGQKDRNTAPSLSETFLKTRQAAGGSARIVFTDGTHSSTRQTTEHIAEQLKTITNTK